MGKKHYIAGKVIDLNERRLLKEIDDLANDKDIQKFAQWVNDNVTEDFLIETRKEENEMKVNKKSVSITRVDKDHTMFGSRVKGTIHVTEFQGDEITGGEFFATMNDAFAHIREYLEDSVVLTPNEIN